MLNIDNVRSLLIDLESRSVRTLELVGSFIGHLEIPEDERYNLWTEWLSYTDTTADVEGVYQYSKTLATVTLEDLEEAASDAVERSILVTDNSLAAFEISEYNFTTPKAVAKQFVAMYRKPIKYVADLDLWLEWSVTHWQPVEETFLMNVLSNAVDRMFKKHDKIDQYETAGLKAFSRTYNKVSGLKEVIKTLQAQHEIEILSKDLDNVPSIIGCLNGAVDLTTGRLIASNQDHYLTKSTNLIYDPEASSPLWLKTVADVFLDDEEMVSFYRRLIGYSILGHNKEHLVCFLYGNGSNGKSTLTNALASVFGDYSKNTPFSSLTTISKGNQHSEHLTRLQGARFVSTSEPNANSELKEGTLKDMSGGDTITCRAAYSRHSVEINPRWVTFIPTNFRPSINGTDNGIWRRLLFIPFTRNFKLEPELLDLDLPSKLLEEKQGILNWIIQGALEYQAEGLQIPERLIQEKEDYRKELDVIGAWIEDKLRVEETLSETNKNLWTSFSEYIKERGYESEVKSSQKLSNNLAARGYERAKRNNTGIRGFLGLKVI